MIANEKQVVKRLFKRKVDMTEFEGGEEKKHVLRESISIVAICVCIAHLKLAICGVISFFVISKVQHLVGRFKRIVVTCVRTPHRELAICVVICFVVTSMACRWKLVRYNARRNLQRLIWFYVSFSQGCSKIPLSPKDKGKGWTSNGMRFHR